MFTKHNYSPDQHSLVDLKKEKRLNLFEFCEVCESLIYTVQPESKTTKRHSAVLLEIVGHHHNWNILIFLIKEEILKLQKFKNLKKVKIKNLQKLKN